MKNFYWLTLAALAAISRVTLSVSMASPSHDGAIKCKLVSVLDEATQIVAYKYFMPVGWETHNSFKWQAARPGVYDAVLACQAPDKMSGVVQIQGQVLTFNESAFSHQGMLIHHATDYLKVLLGNTLRNLHAQDVAIDEATNQPTPTAENQKYHSWTPPGIPGNHQDRVDEVGLVHATFTVRGTPMTAVVGTTVHAFITQSQIQGYSGPLSRSEYEATTVLPTTIVISPTNVDAAKARELQLVASSMTITPKFHGYVSALTDRLMKNELGAAAAAQRYHDATFHDRSMMQFRNQMGLKDANSRQFCNYVRDQQDYKASDGSIVTLPAGYKHVWENSNGDYLVTDDPTVDPKGYGGTTWRTMSKYRPGE